MSSTNRRIAVTTGGAHVPGLNAIVSGVTRAAHELGWTVVGIRDGYEGLLFPERYPDGGLLPLTPGLLEGRETGSSLGTSGLDPSRMQVLTADGLADEADRSAELLEALRREQLDGTVAIVGSGALSRALKLHRRGLQCVCVPQSIENEMAVTERTVGFHSALAFCTELLDRVRAEAHQSQRIAVVEVPGKEAGWLALQSALAAAADVVLIPEIPFDLDKRDSGQHQERLEGCFPVSTSAPTGRKSPSSTARGHHLRSESSREKSCFPFAPMNVATIHYSAAYRHEDVTIRGNI